MVASCRRAALAAFAALAVSASGLSAFAQSITIEILFVTDGHGALAPQGPRDAALRGGRREVNAQQRFHPRRILTCARLWAGWRCVSTILARPRCPGCPPR